MCDGVMAATSHLYVGGHRSVIMSVQNGRVLTLLVRLMRGGREKVCVFMNCVCVCEQGRQNKNIIENTSIIRTNRSYICFQRKVQTWTHI